MGRVKRVKLSASRKIEASCLGRELAFCLVLGGLRPLRSTGHGVYLCSGRRHSQADAGLTVRAIELSLAHLAIRQME